MRELCQKLVSAFLLLSLLHGIPAAADHAVATNTAGAEEKKAPENYKNQLNKTNQEDKTGLPVLSFSSGAEEQELPLTRNGFGENGGLAERISQPVNLDAADVVSESIRSLEGTELHKAVARALADENYKRTRRALTARGPFRQDVAHATAFTGRCGPAGTEVVVVVIPFPDKDKPHAKTGLIAFMTAGGKKAASCCILERAESPSETGAVQVEHQLGDFGGESLWLWEPPSEEEAGFIDETGNAGDFESSGQKNSFGETDPAWKAASTGGLDPADGSKVKKYFKCVFRNASIGCGICMARCVVTVLLYLECVKNCCGGVLGLAMIVCAVEMMMP